MSANINNLTPTRGIWTRYEGYLELTLFRKRVNLQSKSPKNRPCQFPIMPLIPKTYQPLMLPQGLPGPIETLGLVIVQRKCDIFQKYIKQPTVFFLFITKVCLSNFAPTINKLTPTRSPREPPRPPRVSGRSLKPL